MKLVEIDAGKSLKIAMLENDLTNSDLKIKLGLSDVTISRLKNNKLITGKNLVMLATFFDMKASDFLKLGERK